MGEKVENRRLRRPFQGGTKEYVWGLQSGCGVDTIWTIGIRGRMMGNATMVAMGGMSAEELEQRASRWKFFQIVFCFVYAGIVLDVLTTSLGYQKAGIAYEQNPLGGSLIGHLGWVGLLATLTILCLVCYTSVRLVYRRMSTRWSKLINILMVLLAAFRWLAVVTAVIYLLQPTK
jgi:hypothetical protein